MTGPQDDTWAPETLGRTTRWSAEDWRDAYNAYGWRSDWPNWVRFIINSAMYHPSELFNFDPLLKQAPPSNEHIVARINARLRGAPVPPAWMDMHGIATALARSNRPGDGR